MRCSLNVDTTRSYENAYKVIVHKIQAQIPQWIAQWNNLALLLYISINCTPVTSGQDPTPS